MIETHSNQSKLNDAWLKADRAFSLMLIISFALPLLVFLLDRTQTRSDQTLAVGLVTAVIGLHIVVIHRLFDTSTSHISFSARHYALLIPYALITIGCWFVLISLHSGFMFGLSGLFPLVNRYLPRQASMPLNLLIIAMMVVFYSGGSWNRLPPLSPLSLLLFAAIAVPTLTLSLWIGNVIQQSAERSELIEELKRVRRELLAAERQTGVLEERQRLAREIHDTLAQGFTSIVMNLEAAEQAQPDLGEKAQTHLDRARTMARQSLEQSRRVVSDLRPQPLEDGSFPDAIRRVVTNWQASSDIAATATVTGTPLALNPESELALLRAVQESLNNVRKHANANAVNVTLSYIEDVVILDVQDDGVGIKADASKSDSYGLTAMRERIEALKGTFEIETAPKEGTTIVVTVPV